MKYPKIDSEIPFLDSTQIAEVDRLMVEDYGIELLQMMENAGRNLAVLARAIFLNEVPGGKRVTIFAGTGGNGGGAMVCARFLHNWGAEVKVITTRGRDKFSPVPLRQWDILLRMGVEIKQLKELMELSKQDLLIDGIIGYSLKGAPYGPAADQINWINSQSMPVLSLDLPSGFDASAGMIHRPVVKATATMTLALPKKGFLECGAREITGDLFLADIGVPPALYKELGFFVGPIFSESEILSIT